MWTLMFWKAISERAIKTFCQVLAASIAVSGLGVHQVDWLAVLSVAGLAALASLVTSVGSAVATNGSPSLVDAETVRQG